MIPATPITSHNEADKIFSAPTVVEYCESFQIKRDHSAYYFVITETYTNDFNWNSSPIKASDFTIIKEYSTLSQFEIINLASLMFSDSKPLDGDALVVLKRAAEKSLSKTPTSFKRK